MRLFTITALCLISVSVFAIEPPREKERWTTLAIDELMVYSSANDATTRDVASDLVRLRGALAIVTKLKVRSPLPTRVYIFGDRRAFEQYCQASINRSDNLSGVFLSSRDGNHVLIDANASGVDRVVFHELTHYFLRNTSRRMCRSGSTKGWRSSTRPSARARTPSRSDTRSPSTSPGCTRSRSFR